MHGARKAAASLGREAPPLEDSVSRCRVAAAPSNSGGAARAGRARGLSDAVSSHGATRRLNTNLWTPYPGGTMGTMGWLGSIVTAVWILVDVVYSCMGLVIQLSGILQLYSR
jgi:hypothetical protein